MLLWFKKAVSRTLCSLSASAYHVAATGAMTALHKFMTIFYIQLVMECSEVK